MSELSYTSIMLHRSGWLTLTIITPKSIKELFEKGRGLEPPKHLSRAQDRYNQFPSPLRIMCGTGLTRTNHPLPLKASALPDELRSRMGTRFHIHHVVPPIMFSIIIFRSIQINKLTLVLPPHSRAMLYF